MKVIYLFLFFSIICLKVDASVDPLKIIDSTTYLGLGLVEIELLYDSLFSSDMNDQMNDTVNVNIVGDVLTKSNKKDYVNLIIPILTLLLGFFLNRGYDYYSEKGRVKKHGERWIAEFRCLENPIEEQNKAIEEFRERNETYSFQSPYISMYQILNCEIFKSLDKSIFLKFLLTKIDGFSDAILLSNNFHLFISSLTDIHTSLAEGFNKFTERSSKYVESFDDHFQLMMRSFVQLGVNIEVTTQKNPMENDVYVKIHDLVSRHITPFSKDGKINLFEFQDQFISPLSNLIAENRLDDNLKDISIHSSNCNLQIKYLRMEKRYIIEHLEIIKVRLFSSKETLENLIAKLK